MADIGHVVQATNAMREAFARMTEALDRACRELAESLPEEHPDAPTQPDKFEHTDPDGDQITVEEWTGVRGRVLRAGTWHAGEPTLYADLDQDAVNRLGQYLDAYRTDVPCPLLGVSHECAGTRGHEGDCDPCADNVGLQYFDACPWSIREVTGSGVQHKDCEKPAGHEWMHQSGGHTWFEEAGGAYDRRKMPGGLEQDAAEEESEHTRGERAVLCAGYHPEAGNRAGGCEHFRGSHGALGCTVPSCPCERSGGR